MKDFFLGLKKRVESKEGRAEERKRNRREESEDATRPKRGSVQLQKRTQASKAIAKSPRRSRKAHQASKKKRRQKESQSGPLGLVVL